MLFGYLIVRALLVLVRIFGLLPGTASRVFARLLDSAQRPFHLINYLGSRAGARLIPPGRMPPLLDHVTSALQQHLDRETATTLRRGMHHPATWDPFFASYMTLADLYRYPTRHFRFHQRQLTLGRAPEAGTDRTRGSGRGKRQEYSSRAGSRPGAGLTPHQADTAPGPAVPGVTDDRHRQALARRTTRSAAVFAATAETQLQPI